MLTKQTYEAPEAEIVVLRFERRLLNGSPGPNGARTQGFRTPTTYTDDDWDIE